ncbi:hypothetical protein DPMN_171698 [Dreissena polymorpha]|uniref:Uncharacterized protein n=1 Tax=Dreissena polymorpha TaxID=45954 RepID=A0A9D4E0U8_DREPO|nr:hypothetical protein DPMN_171698 [Dreissena polymorpha]
MKKLHGYGETTSRRPLKLLNIFLPILLCLDMLYFLNRSSFLSMRLQSVLAPYYIRNRTVWSVSSAMPAEVFVPARGTTLHKVPHSLWEPTTTR